MQPVCSKCGKEKERVKERWRCKPCENAYCREWGKRNTASVRERHKAYRKANPHRALSWHLKSVFGITLDEYLVLFKAQGGVCAICKEEELTVQGSRFGTSAKLKALAVDHDHETGKVRGLLCSMCNPGLGSFRDDPQLLRAAARYLEEKAGTVVVLKEAV